MDYAEKKGFQRIGRLKNNFSFIEEIGELCHKDINYSILNIYVDELWRDRVNHCLCWSADLKEVPATANSIKYFMIDTGFSVLDHGEDKPIYGGFFSQVGPTDLRSLKFNKWCGVVIGTKQMILDTWKVQYSCLYSYTYVPEDFFDDITSVLNSMTGYEYDFTKWYNVLDRAFLVAKHNDRVKLCNFYTTRNKSVCKASYFPLGIKTLNGSSVWIVMEKNAHNSSFDWFGLTVLTEDALKEGIVGALLYNKHKSIVGNLIFDSYNARFLFLQSLADTAMPDMWDFATTPESCYYILKSYLLHTFHRLIQEDRKSGSDAHHKIFIENGQVYFNTGLLNRFFKQIIITGKLVDINALSEIDHTHLDFSSMRYVEQLRILEENSIELAGVFDGDRFKIPAIASFFNHKSDVVFDASLRICTNDQHIFVDGLKHERITFYRDLYEQCKDDPERLEALSSRVSSDFEGAISRGKLLAERNYKMAIPQYRKETDEIQFLLPIFLNTVNGSNKPDCALALRYIEGSNGRASYYRGMTVLTLEQAYTNTRLIAKPDAFWLNSTTAPID